MKSDSIFKTNEIFHCAQNFTIEYHNIDYSELRYYSTYLQRFFVRLGDGGYEDYWRE